MSQCNVLALYKTNDGDYVGIVTNPNDDTYAFTLSPASLVLYHPDHEKAQQVYSVIDIPADDDSNDAVCKQIAYVLDNVKPLMGAP